MIDPLGSAPTAFALTTPSASTPAAEGSTPGAFDAALKAAQRTAQLQQERQSDLDAIREKGFTDWVRDTRIEALKKKLREKVMAEMGLTDEDLAKLNSAMREIVEAKIREAVEQKMEEEMAKANGENPTMPNGQSASAGPMEPGKNDPQDGKKVPVIAALVQAGGESLF